MKVPSVAYTRPATAVWLLLPALQVLLLMALARPAGPEWLILGSFVLITAYASRQLFRDPHPYSVNKIWWLFSAAFLGIAPSVQAALHKSPWREGDIESGTMLYANGLILLSCLVYSAVRRLLNKKIRFMPSDTPLPYRYAARFRILAPVLTCACGMALIAAYGWWGLFLRGYYEAAAQSYNPTFQLLFDKGIRGILLYLSLSAIHLYRRRQIGGLFCTAMLLACFLLNFPLAFSRNLAFTIYMAWLIAAAPSFISARHAFVVLILGLLLLAAPLADVTRYAGTDMRQRLAHPAALFRKAYLVTDYDAYSSLCRTIQFTDSAGSTRGRQLAGVALFFVPRRLWSQKPIGSGSYLFTRLHFEFKNVSCTYLAEGYINFGLAGTLIFTVLLALIITLYDSWYWQHRQAFRYPVLFYPVFTGMMLFILRGDLLSSYAYTAGLFISGWLLHRLLLIGTKQRQSYGHTPSATRTVHSGAY